MNATDPAQFRHTTLTAYPDKIVGVTLLDESPGFTGIYLRDASGGLWPARTVSRTRAKQHRAICNAWLARPGVHEDKRTPSVAHLFPNGQLEQGTATPKKPRPGYRWVQAYSQVLGMGTSMACTRRNWYLMGKRDGFTCKFHRTEAEARAAFQSEQ